MIAQRVEVEKKYCDIIARDSSFENFLFPIFLQLENTSADREGEINSLKIVKDVVLFESNKANAVCVVDENFIEKLDNLAVYYAPHANLTKNAISPEEGKIAIIVQYKEEGIPQGISIDCQFINDFIYKTSSVSTDSGKTFQTEHLWVISRDLEGENDEAMIDLSITIGLKALLNFEISPTQD
ncbi:MAG: hypothetical protein N2749_06850 [Clostridia bacterium]|nr:hypothetical protein [Clostridia bacterium]